MEIINEFEVDKLLNDMHQSDPDFTQYLSERMADELIKGLLDLLCNGQTYVVKLEDMYSVSDPSTYSISYRQKLSCDTLIHCKDCRYSAKDPYYGYCCKINPGIHWPEYGFCSFAERREDEKVEIL